MQQGKEGKQAQETAGAESPSACLTAGRVVGRVSSEVAVKELTLEEQKAQVGQSKGAGICALEGQQPAVAVRESTPCHKQGRGGGNIRAFGRSKTIARPLAKHHVKAFPRPPLPLVV